MVVVIRLWEAVGGPWRGGGPWEARVEADGQIDSGRRHLSDVSGRKGWEWDHGGLIPTAAPSIPFSCICYVMHVSGSELPFSTIRFCA